MNKQKRQKVHIVPQGLEFDRILAGIRAVSPERVIIIRNTNRNIIPTTTATVDNLLESIKEELETNREIYWFISPDAIDTDSIKTNFFNFPEAFCDILKVVEMEENKGNEITLSIASGTKIIAIAMFLVGLLTHSEIIYVIPKEYVPKDVKEYKRTEGVVGVYKFPHLSISMFENVPFDILSDIEKQGGRVIGINTLAKVKSKSEQVRLGKAIEMLTEQGLVEKKSVGKSKEVIITDMGRELLMMGNILQKDRD